MNKINKIILRHVDYCNNVSYIVVSNDKVFAYSANDSPMSLSNFVNTRTVTCQDLRDKLELGLSQGADHVLKLAKKMMHTQDITIQRIWED